MSTTNGNITNLNIRNGELRIVTKTGVAVKGVVFCSKQLLQHIGDHVVVDDLGVAETDEILIRKLDGTALCFAEKTHRNPFRPMVTRKFERALRKLGMTRV